MLNRDFLEGEFKGIEAGRVRIDSVLFGSKKLEMKREAAALVLGEVSVEAGELEVRLRDGSRVRAKGVKVKGEEVVLEEKLLGEVRVVRGEVVGVGRE